MIINASFYDFIIVSIFYFRMMYYEFMKFIDIIIVKNINLMFVCMILC